MKTRALDYIFSSILLSFITIFDLLCLKFAVIPITMEWFGAYRILVDGLLFLLVFGVIAIICARIILALCPMKPGDYSMESRLFTWWKLFTVIYEFGRGALLPYTTVFARPLVAKLFGANIGKDIALGGRLVDPELITIGDGAIIGQDSVITAHAITAGTIMFRPVKVGCRATIGVNAVIMPGVVVGDAAVVTAGAVVPPETVIPAGEMWGGIPARRIKNIPSSGVPV